MSSQKERLIWCFNVERIIRTGDIDTLKKWIQDNNITHADYSNTDLAFYDVYPVNFAAKYGNVDILNYLLSTGFSYKFGWERAPMLEACEHGHIAVVKVLIELHGVDVNKIYFQKRSECTETALSTAASAGQLEIVQYLLETGASVVPAYNASVSGYKQRHVTSLHAAVISKDVRVVKLICQYIDVNIAVKLYRVTPLTMAASHANGEILTALLDAGMDIEGNGIAKSSPFCISVLSGKLENAKILHSKGANPEKRNYLHCTPLEIAIQKDNYEMVRYLVVELNLPWVENLDKGLLDLAFDHNRTSIIKILIDADFSSSGGNREVSNSRNISDKVKSEIDVLLEQTSSNPRTLKQMCCFIVRRSLGRNLSRGVDTIPLPRPLIDFVKLTHIPFHRPNAETPQP